MKLIKEYIQDLEYITEENNGTKNLYISGVFMQSETQNKNGRIYRKPIIEKELIRYKQIIDEKRSLGELGHPPNPSINLNQVSHLITELSWNNNDVVGKAKILDTPMGKIAKSFIDEGVRLGVSSRGLGSLKEKNGINEVQDDFHLVTVDIVADPSAPGAFVQGVMENAEWVCNNGIWEPVSIEKAKKYIKKQSGKNLEESKLKLFESFLQSIK